MDTKNPLFLSIARIIIIVFFTNVISPTLQYTFADSAQYYVDADGGDDSNDGLSPATAWRSLAQVNGTSILQGDTISFDCNDSWTGGLVLSNLPGSLGLPITLNSYGGCAGNTPTFDTLSINNSSYVVVDGIDFTSALAGIVLNASNSDSISIINSSFSNGSGDCISLENTTNAVIDANQMTGCFNAIQLDETSGGEITNNAISSVLNNGISIASSLPVLVIGNTLNGIGESAIKYGTDTQVTRNSITSGCTVATSECAAIRNDINASGATTTVIQENMINNIGNGVTGTKNSAVLIQGAHGVNVLNNGIQNAEFGVKILNANDNNLEGNTVVFSRKNSISVIQNASGTTYGNTFSGNTIIQRAPDYPYIEIRDETPGSGYATGLLTAFSNTIYPNYKPNTSYVKSTKYGGLNQEFSKNTLSSWDPSIQLFQYFAYKSYTNTGSYATANLITNGSFDTDESSWTTSAQSGAASTLSYNSTGSYSGGSMMITPLGGGPDRLWVSNSSMIPLTLGQTFHVTGYAKSSSDTINLRGYFHADGDSTMIYSDRIAETYASASGNVFSFYLVSNTTASDGVFTFETSNNDTAFELDEVTVRRVTGLIRNTNANEILTFSNTGSSDRLQSCPGGVQCFAYVDSINVPVNWPRTIPGYSTRFVLWNNSPNIINTPTCTLNLSSGSVPSGQPVDLDWTTTNSEFQSITYTTYTGSQSYPVPPSGMLTFIPPYDNNTTITLDTINQVGPNQCSVVVTTNNTAPSVYPTTITGSEDDVEIIGTLSGTDINPGDYVLFELFDPPTHGTINVDLSGSIQYYPNADFCGVDTFMFRASDQGGRYADPIPQTINIACINDAPSTVNDTLGSTGENTILDVLGNDTDPDSPYIVQGFSIVSYTQPINGSLTQSGGFLVYSANNPLSFSGVDTFQYRMMDQSGALSINTGTVVLNVTPTNIAPTTFDVTGSLNEDTTYSDTLTGTDLNNNSLTFHLVVPPTSGTASIDSNGSFLYTPNAHFYGTDSFTYRANDGISDSNISTITLTIDPVPDAPVALADSYALDQDTTMIVPVMANDSDIDSAVLTITGLTQPSHGLATINGTGITYTPTALYAGLDSFSYRIQDDTGLISSLAVVSMTVVSTNSPPTANDSNFSIDEDNTLTGNVTANDPENSTLTYILDTPTTNGVLNLQSNGSFFYTPNPDFSGTDSFVFHVSDGSYNSTIARVDIAINPINDSPIALSGSFTATGNSMSSTGNILSSSLTALDVENDGLSFTVSILPVHGILTLASSGTFTYLPALGYTGSDNFVYSVSDGSLSSTGLISFTVIDNGVPPLPPSIGRFQVSVSGSVYSGIPFTIGVQAYDNLSNSFTTFTGSIIFSSTLSGAMLPNSGGLVPFFLSDAGTKIFSNSVIFSQTGVYTINVQDSNISSASGSITITVQSVLDGGSGSGTGTGSGSGTGTGSGSGTGTGSSPSGSGSSGGGSSTASSISNGGGQSAPVAPAFLIQSSKQEDEFHSAPISSSAPIFIMNDPTGLLGQLFLSNRLLDRSTTDNQDHTQNDEDTYESEVLTLLEDLDYIDRTSTDTTPMMRAIVWTYLREIRQHMNADPLYEKGKDKLRSIDVSGNRNLSRTRDVLLRIFDQQYRRYRETVDRNIVSNKKEETNIEMAAASNEGTITNTTALNIIEAIEKNDDNQIPKTLVVNDDTEDDTDKDIIDLLEELDLESMTDEELLELFS